MENKFEKQKKLASIIKNIHKELKNEAVELGAEVAWHKHLENKEKLDLYAQSMRELSEVHWKERNSSADDRIQWIIDSCNEYFQNESIEYHRQKDYEIIEKLKLEGIQANVNQSVKEFGVSEKLNVIDVGSSGNFFKKYERFDILPIDIAPSSEDVFYCDFLSVQISENFSKDSRKINSLSENFFDVVIFCLFLEYLPTSDMRIKCCEKAYDILVYEGILCIVTPDSNYQHTNAQLIKNWKWTLANIGFKRIKIQKLKNLSCMVFRKSLSKEVPRRWANFHKKSNMEFKMAIPQDRTKAHNKNEPTKSKFCKFDVNLLQELPIE